MIGTLRKKALLDLAVPLALPKIATKATSSISDKFEGMFKFAG